jgi:hypothetical protein
MCPYLPVRLSPGKHFKVYVESGKAMAPSKSHAIELALKESLKDEEHVTEVDFVPGMFVLQMHGWLSKEVDPNKNAAKMQAEAIKLIKAGKDPVREFEKRGWGKWHYDLRTWKFSAPTWFGLTIFSAPWKGTAENKALGTVKGVGVLTSEGDKTQKFLLNRVEAQGKELTEKRDNLFWLKVKKAYWAPGTVANPTKNQWSYMFVIDKGYAVIHRRENDFVDVTYLGKYLNGRYFDRLVARSVKEDEQPKSYKKKFALNFYFWKAKQGQFDSDLIKKVATQEISLSPLEKTEAAKGTQPEVIKKV